MTRKRKLNGKKTCLNSLSKSGSTTSRDPYELPGASDSAKRRKVIASSEVVSGAGVSTSKAPVKVPVIKVPAKPVIEELEEDSDDSSTKDNDILSDSDLSTTIASLEFLGKNQALLQSEKRYKELRRVLFKLGVFQSGVGSTTNTSNSNISTTAKISEMISNGSWDLAISLCQELKKAKEKPKLGTLQRWVRGIDAAGQSNDEEIMRLLCCVLEVCMPSSNSWLKDSSAVDSEIKKLAGEGKHYIANSDSKDTFTVINSASLEFPEFRGRILESQSSQDSQSAIVIPDPETRIRSLTPETHSKFQESKDLFRPCYHLKGADRLPPNKFDLNIFTDSSTNSESDKFNQKILKAYQYVFPGGESATEVKHYPVPHIPGCFLLQDVLTPLECQKLLALAEYAGFEPDEPSSGQPGDSQLAHARVWMTSEELNNEVFERVREFLPNVFNFKGGNSSTSTTVTKSNFKNSLTSESTQSPIGINRRWRCYRYIPGRYYRPHIDGAWPASRFCSKTGKYFEDGREEKYGVEANHNVNDNDSTTKGNLNSSTSQSHFTFLIYLNEDFEGGCTKFFMPGTHDGNSALFGFPVRPQMGSVLVFPHGNCEMALLHEGSPVTKGCKYVVRTEVLYAAG